MSQVSTPVVAYRWFVFCITLGYFLYRFVDTAPGYFGAQFRFLTVWALTASTISAWLMLRLSMGWSQSRHEVFASVCVVMNATVVLMYWKIYLTDPALFYGADGRQNAWHQEYFIHGLGPLLQAIDAFLILGVFRPIRKIIGIVILIPVAYILWVELLVHPLNDAPVGRVTAGLPYRFLNNMEVFDRMGFYITTVVTMLALMFAAWVLAWLLRRVGWTQVN
ncbi:MAG: hypothetical protein AAGA12_05385 [Pseudomonadota bacterium]